MERRVVITGMGIWSCLGTDLDTVKESLYAGKSGIGIQPERLEYGYRSALTGIVEEPVITNTTGFGRLKVRSVKQNLLRILYRKHIPRSSP